MIKSKTKEFADGDLVWKLILPIGTKSSKFGKWSPNWEGPYRINRSAPGNACCLSVSARGYQEIRKKGPHVGIT